ncbi:protein required for cell viability rrp17 [Neofusicoccum parvum]|uniref:Protein required for cell viability rrp17 n=2 Tax=Neofusicoccum parvum TaxID=310453 RepID=A0ACB5S155_9PEZI|nr:putative rrna processing protein rrp17 protein [Neofusicoccum parvum UCRNP2]GME26116.1 protein required for cell viability rrp17 [Neofusicoccum parvum]GME65094.1 protein required for cell viability rrp17 [Neofusicoccum parvum]
MAPPPRKRAKTGQQKQIEEITFDNSARAEYLTGFSKRKQARIKHAQEQAVKREKEERVAQRKERKQDLEAHVAEVNRLLKQANPDSASSSEDEDEDGSGGEWNGIEDEKPQEEIVDHEEEYVDEDKYTTVTVETVDIDRDGFKKRSEAGEESEENGSDEGSKEDDEEDTTEKKANGKRVWTKEKPKVDRPKKKKKKFRYESKSERKVTRDKQRTKNRDQAKARKAKGK